MCQTSTRKEATKMGVLNWAKNKAKETVTNMKAEGAYKKAEKLERREQYNKGYREGQYKRGQLEGAGGIAPVNQQHQQSGGGARRAGASWQPNWKNAGDMFGGFGGGGDAFFGGGQPAPKQAPPMTETIRRPVQPQMPPKQEAQWDPWSMSPGAAGGIQRRKKGEHERDPYDFIL
jgi:hypothetical protein